MVRTRLRHARAGNSLVELSVAIGFAIVLIPAVCPPIDAELRRTSELYEREAARLVLEGELAHARDDAGQGRLAPGATNLAATTWRSAERLEGLVLERRVKPGPEGLLEVAVEARWRSRTRRAPERLELATWVSKP